MADAVVAAARDDDELAAVLTSAGEPRGDAGMDGTHRLAAPPRDLADVHAVGHPARGDHVRPGDGVIPATPVGQHELLIIVEDQHPDDVADAAVGQPAAYREALSGPGTSRPASDTTCIGHTCRCRCGPPLLPDWPSRPIAWPRRTRSPAAELIAMIWP